MVAAGPCMEAIAGRLSSPPVISVSRMSGLPACAGMLPWCPVSMARHRAWPGQPSTASSWRRPTCHVCAAPALCPPTGHPHKVRRRSASPPMHHQPPWGSHSTKRSSGCCAVRRAWQQPSCLSTVRSQQAYHAQLQLLCPEVSLEKLAHTRAVYTLHVEELVKPQSRQDNGPLCRAAAGLTRCMPYMQVSTDRGMHHPNSTCPGEPRPL